jgi:hypothetical protein
MVYSFYPLLFSVFSVFSVVKKKLSVLGDLSGKNKFSVISVVKKKRDCERKYYFAFFIMLCMWRLSSRSLIDSLLS